MSTDASVATLYAPHERRGRYFNPWGGMDVRARDFLRWQLSRNPYRAAKRRVPDVPRASNDGAYLADQAAPPSVTWIGHSTYLVHDGGDTWLTDPVFSKALLVLRRHHGPGVRLSGIPAPRFVVVSHDHYDHLDLPTIARLPPETVVATPKGYADVLRRRGRRHVIELDWWQSATVGDWTLTLVPSQHWCRRGVHENVRLWGSWVVSGHGRSYYFAGDTGYFHGFSEIGRRFPGLDVAMLPIGAYEPRWFMRYQHMDPADAVQAFVDLGARSLAAMHWGTFDLTDEPIDEAPRVLARAMAARRDVTERVHVLPIGGRLLVPSAAA